MNLQDIAYAADAHSSYAKKPSKATRKWDGKTPYAVHPIWCASTIATETMLEERVRNEGIQALLYHDVIEDTTRPIPEHLCERVRQHILDMTFENSDVEMEQIWSKPIEIKLYKLYDKVSNLLDGSWMSSEKRTRYENYTKKLCDEVESHYGELNITRIARSIIK